MFYHLIFLITSSIISSGTNPLISPPNLATCLTDEELKKELTADVVINKVSTSESNCEFINAI